MGLWRRPMTNWAGITIICLALAHHCTGSENNCQQGWYYNSESKECTACPLNMYKPGTNRGPCILCPKDEHGNQARTRKFGSTNITDCFFRPSIRSFSPTFGPVAGGTEVVIQAYHVENKIVAVLRFNHYEASSFVMGRQNDEFISNITCITSPPKNREPGVGPIHMQVSDDQHEYSFDSTQTFQYLPDPIIFNVDKLKTIISGGTELEVNGTFFTSVANPYLVVTRVYHGVHRRFLTPCRVQNMYFMTCITPDLTDGLNITSGFRIGRPPPSAGDGAGESGSRLKRDLSPTEQYVFNYTEPINNNDLAFFAGFKLDGVGNYENYTELPVYWDPNFHRFDESNELRIFDPQAYPFLDIKGERLNYGLTIRDVYVAIGVGDCPVTLLATNYLTCRPPRDQPVPTMNASGPGNTPMVVVKAGVHLSFTIGFLKWVNYSTPAPPVTPKPEAPSNILTLILVVVGVFWVILFAGCCSWCMYKRYKFNRKFGYKYRTPTPDRLQYISTGSDDSTGARIGSVSSRTRGSRLDNGYLRPMLEETSLTNLPNDRHYLNGGLIQNGFSNGVANHTSSNESGLPPNGLTTESVLRGLDEESRNKIKGCCLDNRRLTLGSVIGSGNYGKVYKAVLADQNFQNGQEVAVKTVIDNRVSIEKVKEFLDEGLIMSGFSHEHVLRLHGVVIRGLKPHVVLEYMDKGDLRSYVANLERTMTVGELVSLTHQVAKGMVYLAVNGFIHRDLAARNCMVNAEMQVKIADFGLSRDIHEKQYYTSTSQGRPLPVKWMSIESLNNGRFTTKSDVWSFGVLLWEVLMRGVTPYPDVDNFDMKDYLNAGHRLDQPSHVPDNVYELMRRCWMEDPDERQDFPDLSSSLDFLLNQGGDIYTREYLPVFDGISLSASESSSARGDGDGDAEHRDAEAGDDSGHGDDDARDDDDDDEADEADFDEELVVVDVHVDAVDENSNEISGHDQIKSANIVNHVRNTNYSVNSDDS